MQNKYLDYNGLRDFVNKLNAKYGIALQYKGTIQNIANLPSLGQETTIRQGYMYNITEAGTTTADFVEGAGHILRAGSNVIAVNIALEGNPILLKWDISSGIFNIEDKLTFGSSMPLSPTNGQTFLYLGETSQNYTQGSIYKYSDKDNEWKKINKIVTPSIRDTSLVFKLD